MLLSIGSFYMLYVVMRPFRCSELRAPCWYPGQDSSFWCRAPFALMMTSGMALRRGRD
jgi:hypothetical protein